MPKPRFSVIVPTRERAEMLAFCLRTCLQQDYDDYEVVVSDNCSSPATGQVVQDLDSKRIKYVRADKPLAMNENWNLAAAHASGEFHIYIGDDDGLMPYALRELDRLVRQTGQMAIKWMPSIYTWPGFPKADEANFLNVPLTRALNTFNSKPAMAAALCFQMGADFLPMAYHGVVHESLFRRVREIAGRVFLGRYHDCTSSFAFAYLTGTYLWTDVPMSISGFSGRSTTAQLYEGPKKENKIAEEFVRLSAEAEWILHPWVPNVPMYPALLGDGFQVAKKYIFPHDNSLVLDRKLYIQQCINWYAETDPERWRQGLQTIRNTLSDRPDLQDWFDQIAPRTPPAPRRFFAPAFRGYNGDKLLLSADSFGVTDVAGAVALSANILGYTGGQINYDLVPRANLETALRQAQAQLAASQRIAK